MEIITRRKEPRTVFTSRYLGVSHHPRMLKKWRAAISVLGNKKILGYFDSELEAARAYNAAAIKWGKDRLNVLD